MSVTTTANPVSSTVLQALTDYDLHHSGDPENPRRPVSPNRTPSTTRIVENPENWDNEHRRVPPYRPVDPNRLGPERPAGMNPVEMTFIYVMLNGVGLVANMSSIWRTTGGRLNDHYFRYQIGGEW